MGCQLTISQEFNSKNTNNVKPRGFIKKTPSILEEDMKTFSIERKKVSVRGREDAECVKREQTEAREREEMKAEIDRLKSEMEKQRTELDEANATIQSQSIQLVGIMM